MNQLNKKITFPILPGTVSERLADALEDERKAGGINRALQAWVIAGFQLQELGGGVVETWLALEKNGELAGMTKTQKARVLCELLERLEKLETAEPVKIRANPPAPKKTAKPKAAPISLDDVQGETLADL